jgi:hypothetical protein
MKRSAAATASPGPPPGHRSHPLPWPIEREHIGDEEADGLRPLIVVIADSTLVAALRNRAEIALTHVNRQSP